MTEPMAEATIPLRIADRHLDFPVRIPIREMAVHEAMPVFHALCDAAVGVAVARVVEAGGRISCGPGCGVCCHQLVPMSRSEAVYLRACLETLPAERRAALDQRFEAAHGAFLAAGMLESLRAIDGIPLREERQAMGLRYFDLGVPCPFLEEGSCSIYPWRPMVCREYLVTSPPAACAAPSASSVEVVEMPVKPSNTLFRFDDGEGAGPVRWIPLALLQDPATQDPAATFPRQPGPRLVENFLKAMAGSPGGDR